MKRPPTTCRRWWTKTARCTDRLAALTEEVGRNDSLLRKTQERELELLRAATLAQLFERLIDGLRVSYQLDGVTLLLHDPQHEMRHLLGGDGQAPEPLPGVCFVDALVTVAPQLTNLERPWLGLLPQSRPRVAAAGRRATREHRSHSAAPP